MRKICLILLVSVLNWGLPVASQDLSGLARVTMDGSRITDVAGRVQIRLAISQPVPFRIFTLDAPRRLVLDFNELDWAGLDAATFDQSTGITDLRTGLFRPGWSRIVMDLAAPMAVDTASLDTKGTGAVVRVDLSPTSAAHFQAGAGAPPSATFAWASEPISPVASKRRQNGEQPLVVVLDPGHGGIDPGAERDGAIEAALMLTFALELQELLLRSGRFDVVLTRLDDSFVPLEARVSTARRAGADVFLSLHADALIDGRASGATIYTLSDAASDLASQRLAERHDRGDLLAGVDLSQHDDVVAGVLMDMARTETAPRSDKLADALVEHLERSVGMHKRPKLSAGFSVLKAPDIPSVLIELGFLSSPRDLARLIDKAWRMRAAQGIRDALSDWAISDAAEAGLLRK